MTTPKDKRGGPPGRKTNQQIIEDFLQGLDLPAEVIAAIHSADQRVRVLPEGAPGSFAEMRDLGTKQLWAEFNRLGATAKVAVLKTITDLAKQEEAAGAGDLEPEPLLADIVTGVASLSPIRKRQILTVERARLDEELTAVDGALAAMDAVSTKEAVNVVVSG